MTHFQAIAAGGLERDGIVAVVFVRWSLNLSSASLDGNCRQLIDITEAAGSKQCRIDQIWLQTEDDVRTVRYCCEVIESTSGFGSRALSAARVCQFPLHGWQAGRKRRSFCKPLAQLRGSLRSCWVHIDVALHGPACEIHRSRPRFFQGLVVGIRADTVNYSEVSNLANTNSHLTRMDAGYAVVLITDF